MSDTNYEDMTNKELLELVELGNIKVEDAKNPSKPNKTELVDAIEAHVAKQDADKDNSIIKTPEESLEKLKPGVKKRQETALQLLRKELNTKDRVIINDRQENQTKEESVSVSWGNRGIGVTTDMVYLHGEPQYVRRGALNNLKNAKTTIHNPEKTTTSGAGVQAVPRFIIQYVEGLTQKELDDLAAVQAMRNSKSA